MTPQSRRQHNAQVFQRAELEALIDEYWEAVNLSALAEKSKEDYFYFAYCFVRWTFGEFTPGGNLEA